MDRYSEDELRILKQISEEIFVISNKPQLPFVQKMKNIPCDIMATGYKKIAGDFFYWQQVTKKSLVISSIAKLVIRNINFQYVKNVSINVTKVI